MKLLNIILAIIAILLAAIGLRLYELRISFTNQTQATEQVLNSQQTVISSNQKLELSLNDLRKQIVDIGNQLPRK
jgi:hypothetical protein